MAFGGNTDVASSVTTAAPEKYDGTSWTTTGSMLTARTYLGGCGTQTAGLAIGGSPTGSNETTATEEFNAGPFLAAATVTQS